MKSVLISIHPEWCERIASGNKTLEVRKTCPKIEPPFKCYIYQTKAGKVGTGLFTAAGEIMGRSVKNGKVIGEFICDKITPFDVPYPAFQQMLDKSIMEQSCLTYYQLHRYAYHDCLFGWRISELKIYRTPKELSEFGLTRPPQSWCYVKGE